MKYGKQSEDAVVAEWNRMLLIALDRDSPFAGMIDISGILRLPIPVQRRIHDALTEEQKSRMRELYGQKEARQ